MLVSALIAVTRVTKQCEMTLGGESAGGEMTLGGEFTGGESSWWRVDHKPPHLHRQNISLVENSSSTAFIILTGYNFATKMTITSLRIFFMRELNSNTLKYAALKNKNWIKI